MSAYDVIGTVSFALTLAFSEYKRNSKQSRKGGKRICVFLVDNGKSWEARSFFDMFKDRLSFREDFPGDSWFVCKLAHGEPIVSVNDFDAFIISGSRFNVRDNLSLPWFDPLVHLIRQIAGLEIPPSSPSSVPPTSKRLYGACFGHQIIAHALGGQVDYNPGNKFILKAEKLQLNTNTFRALQSSCGVHCDNVINMYERIQQQQSLSCDGHDNACPSPQANPSQCDLPAESKQPAGLFIICSHGDCVVRLPTDCPCTLLASSESCIHEMYLTGYNGCNILTTQGHPEFEFEYCVRDRILPTVVNITKRYTPEEGAACLRTFDAFDNTSGPNQIARLIAAFLHS